MNNKISNEFNNRVWYPMYRINIFTDTYRMLKLYLFVNRRYQKEDLNVGIIRQIFYLKITTFMLDLYKYPVKLNALR